MYAYCRFMLEVFRGMRAFVTRNEAPLAAIEGLTGYFWNRQPPDTTFIISVKLGICISGHSCVTTCIDTQSMNLWCRFTRTVVSC